MEKSLNFHTVKYSLCFVHQKWNEQTFAFSYFQVRQKREDFQTKQFNLLVILLLLLRVFPSYQVLDEAFQIGFLKMDCGCACTYIKVNCIFINLKVKQQSTLLAYLLISQRRRRRQSYKPYIVDKCIGCTLYDQNGD